MVPFVEPFFGFCKSGLMMFKLELIAFKQQLSKGCNHDRRSCVRDHVSNSRIKVVFQFTFIALFPNSVLQILKKKELFPWKAIYRCFPDSHSSDMNSYLHWQIHSFPLSLFSKPVCRIPLMSI